MFGFLGLSFLINDAVTSRLKGEKGIAEKGVEKGAKVFDKHKESIFFALNPVGYLASKGVEAAYRDVKENGSDSTTMKIAKFLNPALNFLPEVKPQHRETPHATEKGAIVGTKYREQLENEIRAQVKEEIIEEQRKSKENDNNEYCVKKGDCLYNIAKSSCSQGATVAEINAKMKSIMELNGLTYEKDGQHVMIRPGDRLKLAA